MSDLPVMLRVEGRRCVVVGGGGVACRRVPSLLDVGADVTVIAPQIDERIRQLPVQIHERAYEPGDLADAFLVIIATDNPQVNRRIAQDAAATGVWVNRADEPQQGDLTIPAHAHHGPVTIAVATSGISAAAAGSIRRQLSAALDPDWPVLLKTVAPYRAAILQQVTDPRQRSRQLIKLTDPQALNCLKTNGESALRRYCEALVSPNPNGPPPPPQD